MSRFNTPSKRFNPRRFVFENAHQEDRPPCDANGAHQSLAGLDRARHVHAEAPAAPVIGVTRLPEHRWRLCCLSTCMVVLCLLLTVFGALAPFILNWTVVTNHSNTFASPLREERPSISFVRDLVATFVQDQVPRPAGRTNDRDYALEADGGGIYCALTTRCHLWSNWPGISNTPSAIIKDEQVHRCYAMPPSGQIALILSEPILPSSLTLGHVPAYQNPDPACAPRSVVLWGLVDGRANKQRYNALPRTYPLSVLLPDGSRRSSPALSGSYLFMPLAVFDYDVNLPASLQNFPVFHELRSTNLSFGVVVLEVLSNWGSQTTCLYQVRIHGDPVCTERA